MNDCIGVVFGTFAPLHQGHLDLIYRAKKECSNGCIVVVCGFDGDPNTYYNSDYYQWHYSQCDAEPTGRICFRGYGEEYYDSDEHEYFIKPVKDEEVE